MRKIEQTVYTFAELNDTAKERAREWYRSGALDYEWWDCLFDDAKEVGLKLTGFGLERDRHADGKFINGALECAHNIIDNHGVDTDTRKTAEAYLAERDGIVDNAPRDENGDFEDERELDGALDDCDDEFLRALLEDYGVMLQHEYEYLLSDAQVDESIESNGYEFDEDGRII